MRDWQQLLRGFLVALASFGLVLGGLSLSLAEGSLDLNRPASTATLPPSATSTQPPLTSPDNSFSPTPVTPTLTWTPSLPPPPTHCPPPAGWVPYIVQPGDTLESLAASSHVGAADLSQANCLLTPSLLAGVVLYIPPGPTPTTVPCGPPQGWVVYVVRSGDTLFHLSQVYGVSVAALQQANCLGQSSLLHAGQKLYVPSGPTRTPTFTPTRSPTSPTPTLTFTRTPTAPTPSLPTSSPTPSFTPTNSPSPSATDTPTSTPTNTATATSTPTPTGTP